MKRPRLTDVLKSRAFQPSKAEFGKTAKQNPFDANSMDEFVRNRGPRQGLDKVSRAHTGPDSGVNGSRYDDLVRDIDDLDDYDGDNAKTDDDDLYLGTKDRSYAKNEFNQPEDVNDIDVDAGWAFMKSLSELDDEQGEVEDEPEDEESSFEGGKYDGVVRSVKGAYLVSKDKAPDATYTEVWIYNVGEKFDDDANIRKSILAGTDIDPKKNFSEDGSQEANLKSIGNVQFLTISGLPD